MPASPPSLTILRSYATKSKPETLPSSILFSSNEKTLTIFDAYPKAMFHFLVLPRPSGVSLSVFELANLRSLLKLEKSKAKALLELLSHEALCVRAHIEDEMKNRYGFVWDIWVGFHAVPSMEHLHLHIVSSDLCSPRLKNKKHYNTFHPKLGFFLHLEDVLSWFDSEGASFVSKAMLRTSTYEPLTKEDLVCWRCGVLLKNIPTLKAHLDDEFSVEKIRAAQDSQGDETQD